MIATVIHYRGETLTLLRERRPYGAGAAAFLVRLHCAPRPSAPLTTSGAARSGSRS